MKKLPFLLLTLTMSLAGTQLFSAKTYALATDEEITPWYTIAELLDYKNEIKSEDDAICFNFNDWDCWNSFMPHLENDKARALSIYTGTPLTITAFNPALGTITLHYQDDLSENLKDVHVARFDAGDPDYTFNETAKYSLPLKPSTHLAISEKEEANGEGWFAPNQEKTFQMIDANFEDEIDPVFWFYFDTNSTSWGGQYNFKDCIESPDYKEGMECRIVYTKEKPMYIATDVEPTEPLTLKAALIEPEVALAEKPELETPSEANVEPTQNPKAPNTGNYTKPCIEKTVEFPWWLIVIIALGDMAVLWFFWPKSSKKSKKSLDKIPKVR